MQKEKIYTVQEMEEGIPRLTIRGKWLNDIGISQGTKLKYIEGKNMIILVKVPEKAAGQQKRQKEISFLERQIKSLKREAAV